MEIFWLLIVVIGGLISHFLKNNQEKKKRQLNIPEVEDALRRRDNVPPSNTGNKQSSPIQTKNESSAYQRAEQIPYKRSEKTPYKREEEMPYITSDETPYTRETLRPYKGDQNENINIPKINARKFSRQRLAEGIILSEILDKPRAKRPHRTASRYPSK